MTDKKTIKRPKLIAEQGYWFRFDSYEMVYERGIAYVRPKPGATLKPYKPFEHLPQLLEGYLDLGRRVYLGGPEREERLSETDFSQWHKDRDSRNYEQIAAFARRYGLPGILWQCQPQEDWGSQFEHGEEVRKPNIFVPTSIWAARLSTAHKSYTGYMTAEEFLAVFLAEEFTLFAAQSFAKPFLKVYAEPVNGICEDAQEFLRIARDWERFKTGKHDGNDPYVDERGRDRKMPWRQWLRDMDVPNVQLRLHVNGMTQLDYGFSSLITALRIMLMLNAVSGSVRLCALPDCGRPFLARNERSRYCSDSHSNVHRQRLFVERKKRSRSSSRS